MGALFILQLFGGNRPLQTIEHGRITVQLDDPLKTEDIKPGNRPCNNLSRLKFDDRAMLLVRMR